MGRGDRGRPPGTAVGLLGSVLVHAGVGAFAFTQVKPVTAGPPSYAVELVAAPMSPPKPRVAREAVPTPPPEEKPAPGQAAAQAQADQDTAGADAQAAADRHQARAAAEDGRTGDTRAG